MIILRLEHSANIHSNRLRLYRPFLLIIKLFVYWAIFFNISYSSTLPQQLSKPWEISVLTIIRGMPSIDNAKEQSGARVAISNFFYDYRSTLEIGGDFSLAYLNTSKPQNKRDFSRSLYIISPALVARWYITNFSNLRPYLTVGVGPSLLSNNDFEGRKLGLRFSFQDILGAGLRVVGNNDVNFGLYIIHYSNGSINRNNRGITTPLAIKLSYRF